jgi:hypothetical protein
MKKIFLIGVALGLSFFAGIKAQSPVLTAANSNPQIGESFSGIGINYTTPGSGGANHTWDFSGLTIGATQNFSIINSSSGASASSFPNAGLATYNPSTLSYNYLSVTSNDISIEGYVYGPPSNLILPYSNPQKILSYPFSMGSSFADNYTGTYVSGGSTIIRKGKNTVTADGYGTLILPSGTVTNVLRVAVIDDYGDTTSLGVPFSQFTLTTYNWYIPGTHYQILSLTSLNSNGGSPLAQFGIYIDPSTVGIAMNKSGSENISLYPNPADNFLQLGNNEIIEKTEVFSTEGALKRTTLNGNELDISALKPGMYLINVYRAGGITTKKFIKE